MIKNKCFKIWFLVFLKKLIQLLNSMPESYSLFQLLDNLAITNNGDIKIDNVLFSVYFSAPSDFLDKLNQNSTEMYFKLCVKQNIHIYKYNWRNLWHL